MSRSNPSASGTPNPSTRWFEWNGEKGIVRYYDKEAKQNIEVGDHFGFVLLDQLGAVGGWHDPSESGIYSNEVRDTRQDVMVVKSFKGGVLAEGLYAAIKDKVNNSGGGFVANCYIAYKTDGGGFALGLIKFKGAALGAWMEFSKAHRAELDTKAVAITGFTEGKKGRVVFKTPIFGIKGLSKASNDEAVALDVVLQKFLAGYLTRTKRDQVEHVEDPSPSEMVPGHAGVSDAYEEIGEPSNITDDDIPFSWLPPLILPALGMLGAVLA